jgi:hypothetical protein
MVGGGRDSDSRGSGKLEVHLNAVGRKFTTFRRSVGMVVLSNLARFRYLDGTASSNSPL